MFCNRIYIFILLYNIYSTMNSNACILKNYPYVGDSCKLLSSNLDLSSSTTQVQKDDVCQDSVFNKNTYANMFEEINLSKFNKNIEHTKCCSTFLKGKPVENDHKFSGHTVYTHKDSSNNIDKVRISKTPQDVSNCITGESSTSADGWGTECNEFDKYYACKVSNIPTSGSSTTDYHEFDNLENIKPCDNYCSKPDTTYNIQCCNKNLEDEVVPYKAWIIYSDDMTKAYVISKQSKIRGYFGKPKSAARLMNKYDECLIQSAAKIKSGGSYKKYYHGITKKPNCSCPEKLKQVILKKYYWSSGPKKGQLKTHLSPQILYSDNYTKAITSVWNQGWMKNNFKRYGDEHNNEFKPMTLYDRCIVGSGDVEREYAGATRYNNIKNKHTNKTYDCCPTDLKNNPLPTEHPYNGKYVKHLHEGTDKHVLHVCTDVDDCKNDPDYHIPTAYDACLKNTTTKVNKGTPGKWYRNYYVDQQAHCSDNSVEQFNGNNVVEHYSVRNMPAFTGNQDDLIGDAAAAATAITSAITSATTDGADATAGAAIVTEYQDAYSTCLTQVETDQKEIARANSDINTHTNKNIMLYNKEITDLNNELSVMTNKIHKVSVNHSIKNKMSVYLIIALCIIIISYMVSKIAYTYLYNQSSPSGITDIGNQLDEFV
jgi:hypothetical protein